jgi:uncharacterized protein YdiU (UPF0061 family)
LADGTARAEFEDPEVFDAWHADWQARVAREDAAESAAAMRAANPAVIPRNHRVEEAIAAAVGGDLAPFERLNAALARPFAPDEDLAQAPSEDQEVRQTFCGT